MNRDFVNLFHGTDYGCLEEIEENGILSQSSRDVISEHQEGLVRFETVYFYDPRELSDDVLSDFEDVFIECRVPKNDLYVTRYGSGKLENKNIEEFKQEAYTFHDYEDGNLPYLENTSLMFLSENDIPPEDMLALKWSL